MSDSKKNKSKGCVMSQKLRLSGESLRGLRLYRLHEYLGMAVAPLCRATSGAQIGAFCALGMGGRR